MLISRLVLSTRSEADRPQEIGATIAEELTWRLIEGRDTREQRQPAAAPRLLRAS